MEVGDVFELPDGEAHHVRSVLRGREGDGIEVVDGRRRLFTAEIRKGREAVILRQVGAPGDEIEVSLYQAVPKGKHMDLVVEKATEIGVGCIVPLISERSLVRLDGHGGKLARWRRVAEAAARQSLRLRVPEVAEPVSFAEAISWAGGGVVLHNEAGLPRIEEVLKGSPVSVFVGPEGGWSGAELEAAEGAGLALARMGPYRLRSETAGIVAVARARAVLETMVGEPYV